MNAQQFPLVHRWSEEASRWVDLDSHLLICPVCNENSALLDVVDFNKACNDGGRVNPSGLPIYYAMCDACGFCYAPAVVSWKLEDFETKIYNADYAAVDPDYVDTRPRSNASWLISAFGDQIKNLRHLDYGGGNGLLSTLLCGAGFNSSSYDPFFDKKTNVSEIGKFDLITAFEVFEHVPDAHALLTNLHSLLAPNGIILFSTLLSDGNISKDQRLSWWYASPRNGHISLFSKRSLSILANRFGFNVRCFNQGLHSFYWSIPHWASHIIR